MVIDFHAHASPDDRKAEISRLKKVVQKFPELKIVAAHTGDWRMWDEVLQDIAGLDIWLETSMTLKYIEDRKIFLEILPVVRILRDLRM